MYKYFVFVVLLIAACSKPEPDDPDPVVVDFSLIRGADLSALPKILETSNAAYFDADGNYEKLITTFKKKWREYGAVEVVAYSGRRLFRF
jgi:hypothetical protein